MSVPNERPIELASETSRRSKLCKCRKEHHAYHHEQEMQAAGLQVRLPPQDSFKGSMLEAGGPLQFPNLVDNSHERKCGRII